MNKIRIGFCPEFLLSSQEELQQNQIITTTAVYPTSSSSSSYWLMKERTVLFSIHPKMMRREMRSPSSVWVVLMTSGLLQMGGRRWKEGIKVNQLILLYLILAWDQKTFLFLSFREFSLLVSSFSFSFPIAFGTRLRLKLWLLRLSLSLLLSKKFFHKSIYSRWLLLVFVTQYMALLRLISISSSPPYPPFL